MGTLFACCMQSLIFPYSPWRAPNRSSKRSGTARVSPAYRQALSFSAGASHLTDCSQVTKVVPHPREAPRVTKYNPGESQEISDSKESYLKAYRESRRKPAKRRIPRELRRRAEEARPCCGDQP